MDFALFLYDDLVFEDAAARAEQHRREDPEWSVTARLPAAVRPGEGPFSIAASVKLRLGDYMLSPSFALRLMTPHEALASLRGRPQAAS
jgi:hypothetical protein